MKRWFALSLIFAWLTPLAAAEPVDYLRDIKPILSANCYACHGAAKQRSGLRLDTATSATKGGNAGAAIIPGKSADSRLIKAILGLDDLKIMPPKEPRLTAKQIELLKKWIDEGVKAPANEVADKQQSDGKKHWSFQTPTRPALPEVKDVAWGRNGIDRFILARLEKEGITPSPAADRVTLIRRATLDLTGLPPTMAEVEAARNDKSPDWYEKVVDRLLKSPHYGERMARHWLDAARYADSSGFTIDGPRSIWKYRDWVIDAFNKDKPFDQFTIEQLAGDLLPNATLEQRIATGLHRNTLVNQEGGIDLEQFRVESIVDRVNTTGTVFLGLTIGCCQCHDHKFDPLSQREYYQFFAFLNNVDEPTLELPTPEQARQRTELRTKLASLEKQRKSIDFTSPKGEDDWERSLTIAERAKLPMAVREVLEVPENGRTPKQKQILNNAYRQADMLKHAVGAMGQLTPFMPAAQSAAVRFRLTVDKQIADLKKRDPDIVTTLVMQERKSPRVTTVHIQGDFTRKGAVVSAGVPAILHELQAQGRRPAGQGAAKTQGPPSLGLNRLDLAKWIVDPQNPLTARVTVNRFWQQFFGLGLVETENDFGTQGTAPSHPELLDWLATEFVAHKWSMKTMHRLIVTSATYRQASTARPELATVDQRNRLLARQNRLRLEAEIVRDVALSASGVLSEQVGGPSVFPPQPDGVYRFTQVNKDWKPNSGADRYRRGMYTYFWRSAPFPGLTVFDAPDSNSTCTRRNRSNTPLQALTLLNDQAYLEFAQALANRILKESQMADSQRLRLAFELCLARTPKETEERRLGELLVQQRSGFAQSPMDAVALVPKVLAKDMDKTEFAAWTVVSRVLLNLDEFITRE